MADDKEDIIIDSLETEAFKLNMMLKEMPETPELIRAKFHADLALRCIVRHFTNQDEYLKSLEC